MYPLVMASWGLYVLRWGLGTHTRYGLVMKVSSQRLFRSSLSKTSCTSTTRRLVLCDLDPLSGLTGVAKGAVVLPKLRWKNMIVC